MPPSPAPNSIGGQADLARLCEVLAHGDEQFVARPPFDPDLRVSSSARISGDGITCSSAAVSRSRMAIGSPTGVEIERLGFASGRTRTWSSPPPGSWASSTAR
jgi:hypothetical protein